MSVSTDFVSRVWRDDPGVYLEIGPDADGLGLEIRNGSDKSSLEWFGNVRLQLGSDREYAIAVAKALLKVAEHWNV